MSNPLLSGLEKRYEEAPGTYRGEIFDPAHPLYYGGPETERSRITYANVITKSAFLLALLIGGMAVGWMFVPLSFWTGALLILAAFSCLGATYRSIGRPRPLGAIAWAVLMGTAMGAVSGHAEAQWSGIVLQAAFASLAVFTVTILMFASRTVRVSARANKIAFIALEAYGVFITVNIVVRITGLIPDQFGLRGLEVAGVPVGLGIGLLAILLCAYCMVATFDLTAHLVKLGAPRGSDWVIASVLIAEIGWCYGEFLTWIALARSD